MTRIELFYKKVVTTNGFALNHDKKFANLHLGKAPSKNDFLKDVESTVVRTATVSKHQS